MMISLADNLHEQGLARIRVYVVKDEGKEGECDNQS